MVHSLLDSLWYYLHPSNYISCYQAAMESDLICCPAPGVSFHVRTDVPKLNTTYYIYRRALWSLVDDWLEGKVGNGAPTEIWEKDMVRTVNNDVNKPSAGDNEVNDDTDIKAEVARVYEDLRSINLLTHLSTATSHRKWIRMAHEFMLKIGIKCSEKMSQLAKKHDLSKYTHRDVLGYAIMFGDGQINWKKLEDEDEKQEWQNTLDNHYAANPHHPEYFYRKLADGTRDKSKAMIEQDPDNGKDYLDESLIDMLASRGERNLRDDRNISVSKWMDIPDMYLGRYGELDKQYVKGRLDECRKKSTKFILIEENRNAIKGHFDERDVVE